MRLYDRHQSITLKPDKLKSIDRLVADSRMVALNHTAGYYAELDILLWAEKRYGKGFADYLVKNFEPVDIVFRLAEQESIVLLNGGGFDGPEWSIRVSLANLDDNFYTQIAKGLKKIITDYVNAWKKGKGS